MCPEGVTVAGARGLAVVMVLLLGQVRALVGAVGHDVVGGSLCLSDGSLVFLVLFSLSISVLFLYVIICCVLYYVFVEY